MKIASIQGAIQNAESASVSIYDRGFLYGDGVFEVLRSYDGKAFELEYHILRILRSAEKLAIRIDVGADVLEREVTDAIDASGERDAYVRLMVTRGSGPLGLSIDRPCVPLRVVLVEPCTPPNRAVYTEGINAVTLPDACPLRRTKAAGAKVMNYLPSILALADAAKLGASEALFVDHLQNVIEGATSNLFIVGEGALRTPPERAGILAGITRMHLLDIARSKGWDVDETDLNVREVYDADEVFITSSIREIVPVVQVDGHPIAKAQPGPRTRELHRAYRARTNATRHSMPWD